MQLRVALLLCGAAVGAVDAADVGRFAVVQNDVQSQKPGAAAAVPARTGDAIVLDEREVTGAASGAKLTFGAGAVISLGEKTTFAVGRDVVDEATGASTSRLALAAGRARVFVSRFWGGRPKVEVETPTAVCGIKGSEVVIDVAPDGSTTVIVISGRAEVAPVGARAAGRDYAAPARVQVAVGASSVESGTASPAQLQAAILSTEPVPTPPRGPFGTHPIVLPPQDLVAGGAARSAASFASATSTPSSLGDGPWSAPATGVLPETPQRGQDGTAGR